ncbi:hypothetical protein D3C78_1878800 [compost metagenome]
MQTLIAKLREGFALGLGQQRVEVVELDAQFGTLVEKLLQCVFVLLLGCRHGHSLGTDYEDCFLLALAAAARHSRANCSV